MCVCKRADNAFLTLLPSCFHLRAYRSGKLTFDEKADIDTRYIDDDFSDCLEEEPLDEDALSPELGFTDEGSESSGGRGCMGAGLLFVAAAVGFQAFSNGLGSAWENDDGDLGAILSDNVDVDDINTSMGLGNGFGPANVPMQGAESAA
jgi:hypothetical protein